MASDMPSQTHPRERARSSLSFVFLVLWLTILWISGGSSRADVSGQVITRATASLLLIAFALLGPRPQLRSVMPVAIFLFASISLVAIQLIPLPPSIWTRLPGRELFEQAAVVSGQDQPWRPLSLSPGATMNAFFSLIVPVLTLLFLSSVTWIEQRRIITVLLILIIASSFVGLIQFSGVRFDHPFINDIRGSVSGSFANRNHLALFVAIGCVLAPAWAFGRDHQTRWRQIAALGLLPFFSLIILATGSRTGMFVGILGILAGLLIVRNRVIRELRSLPKPIAFAIVAIGFVLLATPIILSVNLGRAISLDRMIELEAGEDLRRRALPTVWNMVKLYFPAGTGFGTFDPAYRIHEPDELLSIQYFNHAHNDLLEVLLDSGLAGLLLLGSAILWWLWKSVDAWRMEENGLRPKLASAILLLMIIASTTDYPVRTPMMMAVAVIAAVWLNGDKRRASLAASETGIARKR